MRRSELRRKTPMRRTAMKRWTRPAEDRVDPQERAYVIRREGACFVAMLVIRGKLPGPHQCADPLGPHASTALDRLTVDHFHYGGGKAGDRAKSDRWHMVAMCWLANFEGPSHFVREEEREYVKSKEGSPP